MKVLEMEDINLIEDTQLKLAVLIDEQHRKGINYVTMLWIISEQFQYLIIQAKAEHELEG